MLFYEIVKGTAEQREEIRRWLPGLDELALDMREQVITAWVTVWQNSSYESLDEVPYALSHKLVDHVSEVVRFGMAFAQLAEEQWGDAWKIKLNWQELIQVLILHDLDKPMLYTRSANPLEKSTVAKQLPHGTLSALILKELGFSENIISAVATHSLESPFHPATALSYVLYYADLFSADHALLEEGIEAFYQKHLR